MNTKEKILIPIKGFNAFSIVFSRSKKLSNSNVFAAYTLGDVTEHNTDYANDSMVEATIFYGVTISKKLAKRAVVRNRVKRLLRESLRLIVNDYFANNKDLKFKYIILSWKTKVEHPKLIHLSDVMPKVKEIIDRISKTNEKVKN